MFCLKLNKDCSLCAKLHYTEKDGDLFFCVCRNQVGVWWKGCVTCAKHGVNTQELFL